MRRGRVTLAVVVTFVAAAVAGCSSTATKQASPAGKTQPGRLAALFVAGGTGGTLTPVAGQSDTFALALHGVEPTVTWFSERPARRAGREPMRSLVDRWTAYGFGRDHPNAAVDADGAVTVVELSDPRYDGDTLTFAAHILRQGPRQGLDFTRTRVTTAETRSFGAFSLFVDDANVAAVVDNSGHLGPSTTGPMLYATFSGETKNPYQNVAGITSSGSVVQNILQGSPSKLDELRGMAVTAGGTLYVANAHQSDSLILAFGPAGADGTRQYATTYAGQNAADPGLSHPYGVAVDPGQNVLASSQDTCLVTRFLTDAGGTGTPSPVAAWLQTTFPGQQFLPGTWVAQSVHATTSNCTTKTSQVDHGLEGPRGVALDGSGNVYLADNAAGKVRVYTLATGAYVMDLAPSGSNPAPVGLYVSGSTLFVSSEGTNRVDAIDLTTDQATPLPNLSLEAPSGITCGPDGALYVNDRKAEKTYRYDLASQSASTLVDYKKQNIDDEPEDLIAATAVPPACAPSSPSPSTSK